MEFIIVTGMSGAGKTNALHALEDVGFYCVDNIPPQLLLTFYDLCEKSSDASLKKVAVVIDSRAGGDVISSIIEHTEKLRKSGKMYKILFLDAKSDVLLIRYKETRRKHPLADEISGGTIEDAVKLEADLFKPIKSEADYVVDTSYMTSKQLKERISTLFIDNAFEDLVVTCVSFGFKYGIPLEADLLFDVRFLENPYYVKELKNLTGLDEPVRDYILKYEDTHIFIEKLTDMLDFLVPLYKRERKSELVIGIGCTGGKHRSVTIARILNNHFIQKGEKSTIQHRDIWKA